jgi:predicted heme/steroid binding protein
MPCCSEHGCRRKTPIGVSRGAFSGRIYAITRSRLISDDGGHSGTFEASEKHDITNAMKFFIKANREWVEQVLSEENGGA